MRKKKGKGNSTQEHIEKQGASHRKKTTTIPSILAQCALPPRKIQASIANPNRKFLRIFPQIADVSRLFFGGSWKEKKTKHPCGGAMDRNAFVLPRPRYFAIIRIQRPDRHDENAMEKSVTHPFGIVGGVKYTLNIEHEVVNLDEYRTYVKHWDMS